MLKIKFITWNCDVKFIPFSPGKWGNVASQPRQKTYVGATCLCHGQWDTNSYNVGHFQNLALTPPLRPPGWCLFSSLHIKCREARSQAGGAALGPWMTLWRKRTRNRLTRAIINLRVHEATEIWGCILKGSAYLDEKLPWVKELQWESSGWSQSYQLQKNPWKFTIMEVNLISQTYNWDILDSWKPSLTSYLSGVEVNHSLVETPSDCVLS